MQLISFSYLVFLLPAALGLIATSRTRHSESLAQWILLAASLAFYLSNETWGAALALASIVLNWKLGTLIVVEAAGSAKRRRLLQTGLIGNIGVLCAFKFVPDTWLGLLSINSSGSQIPLGLSFFTLTQVMFLVDTYEGLIRPTTLRDHANFVAFFPNITAGPILRSKHFFTQLPKLGTGGEEVGRIARGILLISLGLVKKLVFGDSFAVISNNGYAHVAELSMLETWITVFAGAMEVYFDFSGYSDIAFGSAYVLGMTLTRNFDAPFRSVTISEFWRKWHISLSDFITTYLYTPILRRMRKPTLRNSAIATFFAMIVAGVWHGATWNFVLFGVLHGTALAGFQYWKRLKRPLPDRLSIVLTFVFVSLAFVSVKTSSLTATFEVFRNVVGTIEPFSIAGLDLLLPPNEHVLRVPALVAGSVLAFAGPVSDRFALAITPSLRTDMLTLLCVLLAYLFVDPSQGTDFRYRQF